MPQPDPVVVLLVEDNELDAEMVKRGLERSNVPVKLEIARNGVEALELLRGTSERAPLPRPHMLLVDINMPRMNGLELLTTLREDPELSDSVVFMLSTSNFEKDRAAAYRAHAAGYLIKSEVGPTFSAGAKLLETYLTSVVLPQ